MLVALHILFEVFAPDLQGASQLQGGYLPAPQLLVDRSTVRFDLLADLRRGEQPWGLAVLVHRRSFFEGSFFEGSFFEGSFFEGSFFEGSFFEGSFFEGSFFEGSFFELQQRFFEPLHSTLEPLEVLHEGLQGLLEALRGWRRRSVHTRHLLLNRNRCFVGVVPSCSPRPASEDAAGPSCTLRGLRA